MSKKQNSKKGTTDAVEILNRRFGNSAEARAEIEQMTQDLTIGSQIYALRKAAGLTQTQLAERVGTTQSIISDLERAEYQGHTMQMLRRIASALDLQVQVSFIPAASGPDTSPHHAA